MRCIPCARHSLNLLLCWFVLGRHCACSISCIQRVAVRGKRLRLAKRFAHDLRSLVGAFFFNFRHLFVLQLSIVEAAGVEASACWPQPDWTDRTLARWPGLLRGCPLLPRSLATILDCPFEQRGELDGLCEGLLPHRFASASLVHVELCRVCFGTDPTFVYQSRGVVALVLLLTLLRLLPKGFCQFRLGNLKSLFVVGQRVQTASKLVGVVLP